MNRITRDRKLTPEEAARYKAICEQVEAELPELISRYHAQAQTSKEPGMIKEAIEHITTSILTRIEPKVIKVAGDPPHLHRLIKTDGGVELLENAPAYRRPKLVRLDDLITFALNPFGVASAQNRAIFVSQERVILVLDIVNGREFVTLDLVPSPEFVFLRKQLARAGVSVNDLRSALRYILTDTMSEPLLKALIAQVSKITFQITDAAATNVDRGRESLGRQIHQETTEVDMPDERQVFQARMFQNADLAARRPLPCLLDPDPVNRQWILAPIVTEFERFIDDHLSMIEQTLRDGLKDASIPVYRGDPRIGGSAEAPK